MRSFSSDSIVSQASLAGQQLQDWPVSRIMAQPDHMMLEAYDNPDVSEEAP
jgi:hypothetical protein